jgi:hypothetical protein
MFKCDLCEHQFKLNTDLQRHKNSKKSCVDSQSLIILLKEKNKMKKKLDELKTYIPSFVADQELKDAVKNRDSTIVLLTKEIESYKKIIIKQQLLKKELDNAVNNVLNKKSNDLYLDNDILNGNKSDDTDYPKTNDTTPSDQYKQVVSLHEKLC